MCLRVESLNKHMETQRRIDEDKNLRWIKWFKLQVNIRLVTYRLKKFIR